MRAATWVALTSLLVWLGVSTAKAQDDDSALTRAYRKEFAFLEAEKRALQQRLAELNETGDAKVAQAEAEIQGLAGEVMGLTLRADTLVERLADAERSSEAASEGIDLIEATLAQAAAALEKGGTKLAAVEGQDAAARAKQLDAAFGDVLRLLGSYGQVRSEEGSYFGAKGNKIEGRIVRIGRVASYGVGAQSGALAPAGGGRLKLYSAEAGTDAARALASGKSVPTVGMFLYESLEKDFEAKKDKTWLEIVQSGGVIAWVIVGLGALALLMLLARVAILVRNGMNTEKWLADLTPMVRDGRHEEAAALCERERTAPGRVLAVTLRNVRRSREELDDLVSEQMLAETPRLDRFSQMVMVFAAVAPLLGLLGTVTGMISTFDVITEFGTGNPKLLSGGISEALVTTELGLIVAIPSLLGGNMLSAWGERIKAEMDRASLRLTNIAYGKPTSIRESDESSTVEAAAELAPAE